MAGGAVTVAGTYWGCSGPTDGVWTRPIASIDRIDWRVDDHG